MNDAADVSFKDYNNTSHHRPQRRWGFEEGTFTNTVQAAPDSYGEPEQRLSLNQIAVPEDYIQVRRRDVTSGAQRRLLAVALCALSGAAGLAFIGGSHLLAFAPARVVLARPSPNCSAPALNSTESSCIALKSDREAMLDTPRLDVQRIAHPTSSTVGHESTKDVAPQATAPTNTATRAMKQNNSLPAQRVGTIQPRESVPKPTLVPETKPTTIVGWKVREVLGETAVVEGSDGILRVTTGDTVPGLGKVGSIVHWGSRWIVATSRGLISTP